jgi:tetratricopeptide (TPR) repeat protein
VPPADVTWITSPESPVDAVALDEVESVDFRDALIDPGVVKAIYTETPTYVPAIIDDALIDDAPIAHEIEAEPLIIEPLVLETVPELDDAIAAGHELVELAEADAKAAIIVEDVALDVPEPASDSALVTLPPVSLTPVSLTRVDITPALPTPPLVSAVELDAVEEVLPPMRPPFRLDPHDFILPGELPPLLLTDEVVNAGLQSLVDRAPDRREAGDVAGEGSGGPTLPDAETVSAPLAGDAEAEGATPAGVAVGAVAAPPQPVRDPASADAVADAPSPAAPSLDTLDQGDALADSDLVEDTDEPIPTTTRSVSVTPSLPIAAVAEAAATVASSRRDSLRAAVGRLPKNWLLRRRLAEALFEAGERDAALHELETAQLGLVNDGEFPAACYIADELVHVSPDRVAYHQKRVELAVRSNDQQRLRFAYLDLADALVRLGEEGRARAVYARVLEIDPYDDRARAALGAAAPPPPPPPVPSSRPDDENFVDLADWLRDDAKPADTRMRMREPAISGDEQADFDALLRHFKEGVSRSLGEDDFESHYDLGVSF